MQTDLGSRTQGPGHEAAWEMFPCYKEGLMLLKGRNTWHAPYLEAGLLIHFQTSKRFGEEERRVSMVNLGNAV